MDAVEDIQWHSRPKCLLAEQAAHRGREGHGVLQRVPVEDDTGTTHPEELPVHTLAPMGWTVAVRAFISACFTCSILAPIGLTTARAHAHPVLQQIRPAP